MAPVKTTRPVLPGEIYRSNDLRDINRCLRVLVVSRESVTVEKVAGYPGNWQAIPSVRQTTIRRAAFHSKAQRGYTLIDSPMPTQRIVVEIDGADDLIAQRLFLAIEQEAQDFRDHHTQVTITADGSHHTTVVGRRSIA